MKQIALILVGVAVLTTPAAAQAARKKCSAEFRNQATACIMAPAEGATLKTPSVKVSLASSSVQIAPVASGKAGAAHFHVFLDVDGPTAGEPIPQGPGITHLGDGKKEMRLENVTPGSHRIIVVLGDNAHVPVKGHKADTTYFTIAAR
jgi:hypothetical protein